MEILYLSYFFLFLFDNTTSYFVYAQNALQTANINKKIGEKQSILQDG